MKSDNRTNNHDSVTASNNEPRRYETLTESEYLTHESELAKTAIARTIDELKESVLKAGDVRLWTHHHPWAAVGIAAATGFSLAAAVRGAGKEDEPDEDEKVTEARNLLLQAAKAPYDDLPRRRRKAKVSNSLLGSFFNLARTAIEASLVAAMRAEGVERAYQSGHAPHADNVHDSRPKPSDIG
jgi:hypothetical protein